MSLLIATLSFVSLVLQLSILLLDCMLSFGDNSSFWTNFIDALFSDLNSMNYCRTEHNEEELLTTIAGRCNLESL